MKSIEIRLAAMEKIVRPPGVAPLVVVIRGGLDGGDPRQAEAGGRRWTREAGESFAAFRRRVMASAGDMEFIVFGGLPDGEEPVA